MKKCPNCGAHVKDDSLFCTECGKPIPQGSVCPHCGASINDGDSFCQNCGKSLNEAQSDESVVYEEEPSKSGFKKYLPYILGVFLVLALIGYFSSDESNDSSNSQSKEAQTTDSVIEKIEAKKLDSGADYTEEDIKNSLESMYKEIFTSDANEDFDVQYTSTDYQSLLNKAYEVATDEVVIDANHWIQGQDCDKPSMSVISVKKESDTKAVAKINIKQFQGNDDGSLVRLILLFENGKWVVDDFVSLWDGGEEYSEKTYLKKYIEDSLNKPKEDYSWLQGHWVYEQGNYKGHFVIEGNTITQYSSMNPKPDDATFRIEDGAIRARLIDGMDLVVPIDFVNHRIDYGDGNWMHKVE